MLQPIFCSAKELDILNNALQRRLEVLEQEKERETVKNWSFWENEYGAFSQGDANRKEAELLSYKRRQEQLQKDLMNTSMENRYTNTQEVLRKNKRQM